MKKRLLSGLLAICLLFVVLPTTVGATNQPESVIASISNYISANSSSFKSSYCGKAWGCFAFCNYVWKGVFGKDYYAGSHTTISNYRQTNDIYGFLSENDAKAGDILWCHNSTGVTHNMIVLAYDTSGIWIADGYGTGKLWHNNNKIDYNNTTYSKYFGGQCELTLYKVNDKLWNNVASQGSSNTPIGQIKPVAKPQTPVSIAVSSTEDGTWRVYIPANYKLLLYSSATSTTSTNYMSPANDSYRIICSKKTTLSNGTVRYYSKFNTNDYYWLSYTSDMTVEDGNATKIRTVNFNANGGIVSTGYKQVVVGGTYGDLPIPTRSGYTFDGWYTIASGGKQVTSPTFVNLTGDQITLYAHWVSNMSMNYIIETGLWDITIPANCPVTYYAGPGSMVVSGQEPGHSSPYRSVNLKMKAVLSDETIRLSLADDKWFSVTSAMLMEDRINPTYTVTLNTNGGNVSPSTITVTQGGTYGELPTPPTRIGYTFDGWYTAPTGGAKITSASRIITDADHNLYAHWTKKEQTWGAWSAWTSDYVASSDTRQVESQNIKVSDEYTEYRYGRYIDSSWSQISWCGTYMEGWRSVTGNAILQYTGWSTKRYDANGKVWSCGYCSGDHVGVHHVSSDGRAWWVQYDLPIGTYYWEESRTIEAKYETQYRYRDII